MPRPNRASICATLIGAVALAAGPGPAAAQQARAEVPFLPGVRIERPRVGLTRVLHRGRLILDYSCTQACRPFMRLRVAGVAISALRFLLRR